MRAVLSRAWTFVGVLLSSLLTYFLLIREEKPVNIHRLSKSKFLFFFKPRTVQFCEIDFVSDEYTALYEVGQVSLYSMYSYLANDWTVNHEKTPPASNRSFSRTVQTLVKTVL